MKLKMYLPSVSGIAAAVVVAVAGLPIASSVVSPPEPDYKFDIDHHPYIHDNVSIHILTCSNVNNYICLYIPLQCVSTYVWLRCIAVRLQNSHGRDRYVHGRGG